MLQPGDQTPDFSLPDQNGNRISLSDLTEKKLVLYFYPKDQTPGCIKEACSFRDNIDTFEKHDITVIGVSIDNEKSHQNFISKQHLNFPLLADVDKEMVTAFGVWGEKSMYGRKFFGTIRKTFLINADGTIEKIYHKVKVATHAEDILKDWGLL